jgi:type II secretory pathway predicted ATPase ExeA
MDLSHFGLKHRPFPTTPDTGCYYPATTHERALSRLLEGLREGEGLILLVGEPGTGKTLLCHCLLDRLGAGASASLLTHGHFRDRAALLQAILYDLSLPYEGRGEQEMRLALTDHLLAGFSQGKTTILIVDEAHLLGPEQLEELRLLGNLEARGGKALQVVLVAQPSIRETLKRSELASLRQRLAVRIELEALDVQEAADYLLHHLRIAGVAPGDVLADEAMEMLARGAKGVPRLLNQSAHQAMALAQEAGATFIDVEAALEALALLGLDETTSTETSVNVRQEMAANETDIDCGPILCDAEPEAAAEQDGACRLFVAPGQPA